MALGDSYATRDELKARMDVPLSDTADDSRFDAALASASRGIEQFCGRQFNQTTTASARVFYPINGCLARVDDFHTTTDLAIATDDGDAGSYSTTWSTSDYQLEPLNGIVDGESGWPYYRIRAVGSRHFPTCNRRVPLQITARWGWAEIPAPVKEACLILAEEAAKLANSPFGVGGYGQFGILRVRDNPMAARVLMPYRHDPVLVA